MVQWEEKYKQTTKQTTTKQPITPKQAIAPSTQQQQQQQQQQATTTKTAATKTKTTTTTAAATATATQHPPRPGVIKVCERVREEAHEELQGKDDRKERVCVLHQHRPRRRLREARAQMC